MRKARMTTRTEQTGTRSLAFSGWIRKKLPDSSTGFCAGNQDWIFWNWKRQRLLLAEEKTHDAIMSKWFNRLISDVLDPALIEYCPKHSITYFGYYLITFENTDPSDGKIWLWKFGWMDRKPITEEQLIIFLSLN